MMRPVLVAALAIALVGPAQAGFDVGNAVSGDSADRATPLANPVNDASPIASSP